MAYAMERISLERLSQVHPVLKDRIVNLAFQHFTATGNQLRVMEGLRTWGRQAELYAQGRTMPGAKVTNAKPGYSWHQFGLAVDVIPMESAGPIDWNPEHPVWQRLIRIADTSEIKLAHVNLNRMNRDWPHFQLPEIAQSPTDEIRALYLSHVTATQDQPGQTVESTLPKIWNILNLFEKV